MRKVRGELNLKIKVAKENYRRTLWRKVQHNNYREVRRGMRTIAGFRRTGSGRVEGSVHIVTSICSLTAMTLWPLPIPPYGCFYCLFNTISHFKLLAPPSLQSLCLPPSSTISVSSPNPPAPHSSPPLHPSDCCT